MEVNEYSVTTLLFFAIFCILLLLFIMDRIPLRSVRGRYVFVSGCDSGFGNMLTKKLLAEGLNVFAGCFTTQGREELYKSTKDMPGSLETLDLDIRNQQSVDQAADFVRKRVGDEGLWALVNNAGVMGPTALDDFLTTEDYQATLEVNALGTIRLTHAMKPMVKQVKGRIIAIASVMGRVPKTNFAAYCVSKFALEAYCDCLRLEMLPFGVSVHILEPGGFGTELTNSEAMLRRFYPTWERASPQLKAEYGQEYFVGVEACVRGYVPKYTSHRYDYVIDAYSHAITAKYPRKRYWVGWDALFFFIPFSMLPTGVQDFFWRSMEYHMKAPYAQVCKRL